MRDQRRFFAAFFVFLCVSGCASVSFEGNSDEAVPRQPLGPEHEILVFEMAAPQRAHEVIGSVRARVKLSPFFGRVWSRERILARLKDEARALGGDALIGFTIAPDSGGGDYLSPEGVYRKGKSEIWSALVVVWSPAHSTGDTVTGSVPR